jgi:DNA-binding transcriptional MerR regulator
MHNVITEPADLILSSEAARIAQVSVQSIRQWERTGRLRAIAKTSSGLRVFSRADVEQIAREREQRHEPETAAVG